MDVTTKGARLRPGLNPSATARNVSSRCAAKIFVRNREQFMKPPFNLKIDEAFVARLTDFISDLALKGMARRV